MNQGLWNLSKRSSPNKNSWIVGLRLGLPTLGITADGADGSSLPRLHQSSRAVFPWCGGTYWPDLKKRVTSSMVQRMEWPGHSRRTLGSFYNRIFISKRSLSLSSFILSETRTPAFLPKLANWFQGSARKRPLWSEILFDSRYRRRKCGIDTAPV